MKILKTEKYALVEHIDWKREQEKASRMSDDSLLMALKDAIEAIQVGVSNEGKYYDQASVYRRELEKRGYPISKQDRLIANLPSAHLNPPDIRPKDTPMGLEDDNPVQGVDYCH